MICFSCKSNIPDDQSVCPICGANLLQVGGANIMMQGKQQNYGQSMETNQSNYGQFLGQLNQPSGISQPGQVNGFNQPMGQPGQVNGFNRPMGQPKKSKKGLIIGLSVVAALALAVGGFILYAKNKTIDKSYLKNNLPETFTTYTLDGVQYECDVTGVKIKKQRTKFLSDKIDAEISLLDENMDRTVYCTLDCSRKLFSPSKWTIDSFETYEDTEIDFTKNGIKNYFQEYEVENISNAVTNRAYSNGKLEFSCNIDDSYDYISLSGLLTLEGNISETVDENGFSYETDLEINTDNTYVRWDMNRDFKQVLDDGSEEVIGLSAYLYYNGAELTFVSKEYGTSQFYLENDDLFDENKKIGCSFECETEAENEDGKTVDVTYKISFTKDSIGELEVLEDGKTAFTTAMESGAYNVVTSESVAVSGSSAEFNVNSNPIKIMVINSDGQDLINDYFLDEYSEYSNLIELEYVYSTDLPEMMKDTDNLDYDMYFVDSDYMGGFQCADVLAPASTLGFDVGEYKSSVYDYIYDNGCTDGTLYSVTNQNCVSVMFYRKDIAEKVFGTSNPDEIQELFKDWDSFSFNAGVLSASGYDIIAGPDSMKTLFTKNNENPWVVNGKLNVRDEVLQYINYANSLISTGCTDAKEPMWSNEWSEDMQGDVFAYFGPDWFIKYIMTTYTEGAVYMACEGPQNAYWGGTYFGASKDCANPGLAGLIMYTLTCDTEVVSKYAYDYGTCVSNKEIMSDLAENYDAWYETDFNQNVFEVFESAAYNAKGGNWTKYDYKIQLYFDEICNSHFDTGDSDVNSILSDFEERIYYEYPELQ